VGEKESESFQFTFNSFLKVAFQGSRVTSDAGLILVRELDKPAPSFDFACYGRRRCSSGRVGGWLAAKP
jgi:hypothetical protein